MKKVLSLFLICMFALPVFAQLTDGERLFAVNYMKGTEQNILDTIFELDDEELNYKPEDGGWSVSNCLEHILLTEALNWTMLQNIISNPDNILDVDYSMYDGVVIGFITNRGNAVQTAPQLEPKGNWDSREAMLDELKASREKLIEFIETTDVDLRQYKISLPFGSADAYQYLLFIAAHSQRHTLQMDEVIAEMNGM